MTWKEHDILYILTEENNLLFYYKKETFLLWFMLQIRDSPYIKFYF